MHISNLESQIESFFAIPAPEMTHERRQEALSVFAEFKSALDRGEIRAASRGVGGDWVVNKWVKRGILLGFRLGAMVDYSIDDNFRFFDKDTYPTKRITINDGVRIVPGGTTAREGAYLGQGVTIMPPAFVNVGAYGDDGPMID
jgi:2,3,4,5-tetrahydropyridine-2-carboxylate N-succinyltransferase